MKYFYKIKNTKTGLYKTAGSAYLGTISTYGWSKQGKVWKNIAALMGHFALYGNNKLNILMDTKDWVVEMYPAEPSEAKSVAEFLKERWEKK